MLTALVVWPPPVLKKLPLFLPILCIALGAALVSLPQITLRPLPFLYPEITERFTERRHDRAHGRGTEDRPDLSIAGMGGHLATAGGYNALSIAAITLLTAWALGLPWALALLLAASLAPTDSVLASDMQVGPSRTGDEDEVRFGLTSETGLTD